MGVPVDRCEPWVTADMLCCPDVVKTDCATGDDVPGEYVWNDDALIEIASNLLYRQTCRLFPGHCQYTVRPCATCPCEGRPKCGCGRYKFIDLQRTYPVISVDEVKIDGVVLDASAYRVDDFHRLVRIDEECWPTCNDLSRADTEPDTFSVKFTSGRRPPIELQMAAAELACELKRACNLVDCRLPANVTSVSRQGVTMNIDALEAAVNGGASGLASVDIAVAQYNCARTKSQVRHPGLRGPRGVFPS